MNFIKCEECNKEYDGDLKICPNCGYENKKAKKEKIIKIVLYALIIYSAYNVISFIFSNSFEKVRIYEDFVMAYGNELLGNIAYYLSIIRDFMTFASSIGIVISCYYMKNDKLKQKLKIASIICYILFSLLPLMFAIICKSII